MFAKNGCRGFPYWLKEIPGIVFRTDNQPFKVSSMKLDRGNLKSLAIYDRRNEKCQYLWTSLQCQSVFELVFLPFQLHTSHSTYGPKMQLVFYYWFPLLVLRVQDAMQTFVTKIVSLMKDNGLMSGQGGPVILAQVWGPANMIWFHYRLQSN